VQLGDELCEGADVTGVAASFEDRVPGFEKPFGCPDEGVEAADGKGRLGFFAPLGALVYSGHVGTSRCTGVSAAARESPNSSGWHLGSVQHRMLDD
jgi:hypothetical protein